MYETLEVDERRNRAQLMETYKYLNNHYKTRQSVFFQEEWREDTQKRFQKRARLRPKKQSFKKHIIHYV